MRDVGALRLRRAAVAAVMAATAAISIAALFSDDGPEPGDLADEVTRIEHIRFHRDGKRPVVVFTGSSSIRLWKDVPTAFPRRQVVNTGFGGSTMANLVRYADPLILRFHPDQVVIHEGDNDLASGATAEQIMAETRTLTRKLQAVLPDTEIVLISAKPSLARWRYHDEYRDLNTRYRRFALGHPNVAFVDVWSRMTDANGHPRAELFASDGLHLNAAGYAVWHAALQPYVDR